MVVDDESYPVLVYHTVVTGVSRSEISLITTFSTDSLIVTLPHDISTHHIVHFVPGTLDLYTYQADYLKMQPNIFPKLISIWVSQGPIKDCRHMFFKCGHDHVTTPPMYSFKFKR